MTISKFRFSVVMFLIFGYLHSPAFSQIKFSVERDGFTWVALVLPGGKVCEGSDGFIESRYAGAQGGSYFNVDDTLGSNILLQEFRLTTVGEWVGNAGYSIIDIAYANGSSSNRPMQLEIDYPVPGGYVTEIFELTLAPTGAWDLWDTETINVPEINTGTSLSAVVRLISLTEDGGPNIDTLEVFLSRSSGSSGGGGGGAEDCPSAPIAEPELLATLQINSDWEAGYCAEIILENTSDELLDWDVSLEVEGEVNNLWNASWSQDGAVLSLEGLSWNNTIAAGETQRYVGFCASRN